LFNVQFIDSMHYRSWPAMAFAIIIVASVPALCGNVDISRDVSLEDNGHIVMREMPLESAGRHEVMNFTQTITDTLVACFQANLPISDSVARAYPLHVNLLSIPLKARITDLDLHLNISHDLVNQLRITLYSPRGRKAEVLRVSSCHGQPVQFPKNINVTFNDQAYDINVYNQTGQRIPATRRCTNALPSIGAYNYGQMKPGSFDVDVLTVFNDQPLITANGAKQDVTVKADDFDVSGNRFSSFKVHQFILGAGLHPGDRMLLEYSGYTAQPLQGLSQGELCLFEVINNYTLAFIPLTGAPIGTVPSGSTHTFQANDSWLLLVEDVVPQTGGHIHEVCLRIGYALEPDIKSDPNDTKEFWGNPVDLAGAHLGAIPHQNGMNFPKSDFGLYQNEPNPFHDLTIIGFDLPERTTATLKVHDVTGKLLKAVSGEFARGYNQVNLTRAELQGNGMLIYQLDTPTHSATKRMILLD